MDPSKIDYPTKFVFIAEWFDYERSLRMQFYLKFYPFDNSVELFCKNNNSIFLRRSICENVSLKDMFIGNTVRIYGRQMNILDYGDIATKKLIAKKNEKTLAVFKPNVIANFGQILSRITAQNFRIMKLKMCRLDRALAMELYASKRDDPFLPFLIENIILGPIIAAELVGEDAVAKWRKLMGPTDPAVARGEAPQTFRAIYGQEMASNGFHGPDDEQAAIKELEFFFPKSENKHQSPPGTGIFTNTTLCIIKPHAIDAGQLGMIVQEISQHFQITAMEMFNLSNANAEEFLEVYKGVVSDFNAMLLRYVDGPLMALEIAGQDNCDAHKAFREFTGPIDPDIARQIRPNTLRAKYGIDKWKNAVHCTDLPKDTVLELEYFFKILQE